MRYFCLLNHQNVKFKYTKFLPRYFSFYISSQGLTCFVVLNSLWNKSLKIFVQNFGILATVTCLIWQTLKRGYIQSLDLYKKEHFFVWKLYVYSKIAADFHCRWSLLIQWSYDPINFRLVAQKPYKLDCPFL